MGYDVVQVNGPAEIMAAVPQVEVGALYGTELLLRYIPPIRLDASRANCSGCSQCGVCPVSW